MRVGQSAADLSVDAVGPERYTFRGLVRAVGEAVGRVPPTVRVPPRALVWAGAALGRVLGDIVISWDEVAGIMAGHFASDGPPTGETRLSVWLAAHAATLGLGPYPSELRRHYR